MFNSGTADESVDFMTARSNQMPGQLFSGDGKIVLYFVINYRQSPVERASVTDNGTIMHM